MSTLQNIAGAAITIAAIVTVILYLRNEPDPSGESQTAVVDYVIDGDTFTATTDGGEDLGRVRVLGIDTPEMTREGNPAECHAQAATTAAQQLLGGRTVQISTDPAVAERDRYDRLLAYVDVDGSDFSEVMLANGHARAYKGSPLQRQSSYDVAVDDAQTVQVGLWGKC